MDLPHLNDREEELFGYNDLEQRITNAVEEAAARRKDPDWREGGVVDLAEMARRPALMNVTPAFASSAVAPMNYTQTFKAYEHNRRLNNILLRGET